MDGWLVIRQLGALGSRQGMELPQMLEGATAEFGLEQSELSLGVLACVGSVDKNEFDEPLFFGFITIKTRKIDYSEGTGNESVREVSEERSVDAIEKESTHANQESLKGVETIKFPADSAAVSAAGPQEGRGSAWREEEEVDVVVEQSGEGEASTADLEQGENEEVAQETLKEWKQLDFLLTHKVFQRLVLERVVIQRGRRRRRRMCG
ncbi:hypothetical protein Emed_006920 [Eimeria media]